MDDARAVETRDGVVDRCKSRTALEPYRQGCGFGQDTGFKEPEEQAGIVGLKSRVEGPWDVDVARVGFDSGGCLADVALVVVLVIGFLTTLGLHESAANRRFLLRLTGTALYVILTPPRDSITSGSAGAAWEPRAANSAASETARITAAIFRSFLWFSLVCVLPKTGIGRGNTRIKERAEKEVVEGRW